MDLVERAWVRARTRVRVRARVRVRVRARARVRVRVRVRARVRALGLGLDLVGRALGCLRTQSSSLRSLLRSAASACSSAPRRAW